MPTPDQILRSVAMVIASDHRVGKRERKFLEGLQQRLGLTTEVVEEAIGQALMGKRTLRLPADNESQVQLLELMIQAAAVDGEIDPNERKILDAVAGKIGMPRAQLEQSIQGALARALPGTQLPKRVEPDKRRFLDPATAAEAPAPTPEVQTQLTGPRPSATPPAGSPSSATRPPELRTPPPDRAGTAERMPPLRLTRTQKPQENAPHLWREGDVLFGIYEITDILGQSGVGRVYKANHRLWSLDLVIKSTSPQVFAKPEAKEAFTREVETWAKLPTHPHVISCYYVRPIGSAPQVVVEYAGTESLSEAIRDRSLYEGGEKAALGRMLDIATQIAWGVQHAHDNGIIHQDVKPGNVILAADGTARVTDFSMARATAAATPGGDSAEAGPLVAAPRDIRALVGGMSAAYCSPEQRRRLPLTKGTDAWSWAITLLELFTGEIAWLAGPAVPLALEEYWESGASPDPVIPRMPEKVRDLIKACFAQNPEERPTLAKAAETLRELYQEATGSPYPRSVGVVDKALAERINNRALLQLDLQREEEATRMLNEAAKAEPASPEALYNQGILLWRAGRMGDDAIEWKLQRAAATAADEWLPHYLLGLLHLERRDAEAAAKALETASTKGANDPEVRQALGAARAGLGKWPRLLRELGAQCEVRSVVLTADGRWALAGTTENTVHLWDLSTGKCEKKFEGHRKDVLAMTLSPDGKRLLTGSEDGTLRLWEIATGKCVRTFEGHSDNVTSVGMSSDGRFAISGSADHNVRVWDLTAEQSLQTLEGHQHPVIAVLVLKEGKVGFSASPDDTLRKWDLAEGKCLETWSLQAGTTAVHFTPDGRWALTGTGGGEIRLWDLTKGQAVRTFEGHNQSVLALSITPDGRWALSGGIDETLRLWECATGRCLRTFTQKGVACVAITPDGKLGLSGESDTSPQVWSLDAQVAAKSAFIAARPRAARDLAGEEGEARSALDAATQALRKGETQVAVAALLRVRALAGYQRNAEMLGLWHRVGAKGRRFAFRGAWQARAAKGHTESIRAAAIVPDGRVGLTGSSDASLRMWDLSTGRCISSLDGHEQGILSVAMTPDGANALSSGLDAKPRLWDLSAGNCLRQFEGHAGKVFSASLTPDGQIAVTGGEDATVRLWDVETGRCVRRLPGAKEGATLAAVSPDGLRALAVNEYNTLFLWDLATGKSLRTYAVKSVIGAIELTPDGRLALSASQDGAVRLWELASGRCMKSITVEGEVTSVALTPDGRWALLGGKDKKLRVADLANGTCVWTSEELPSPVLSLAMTPDGRRAIVGCEDPILRVFDIDWDYEFPEAADWDEGARPWLNVFLSYHTPVLEDGIRRQGTPEWTEPEFGELVHSLQCAGFGWLRAEGVRQVLDKMAGSWKGPAPLTAE
ncbi:MAG: protein kinase [Planctomycetes bacterium]|nr:protein kinase [Planctomycetota bacterium]